MCGICGIYQTNGTVADRIALSGMTRLLAHRGPDGDGHYAQGPVAIGHRRLAIIDPRGGAQPMHDSSERYLISYNGEIYNYQALRESLTSEGAKFRTASDTEVILEGFARHGAEFFEKLNGMFAFAIVDTTNNTLTLARDRLGIKPLYLYDDNNGTLLFASEIKAFYAHPSFTPSPNLAAIKEYLTFSNIHQNISFFSNVSQLPQGTWVQLSGAERADGAYWQSQYTAQHASHGERVAQFRELIDASVQRHLVSDVPVGCYLSGGIDSSGVAVTAHRIRTKAFTDKMHAYSEAEARKQSHLNPAQTHNALEDAPIDQEQIEVESASGEPTPPVELPSNNEKLPHPVLEQLHVFTGTFPGDAKYTELPAARTTATSIGAKHHVVTVTPEDFLDSIEDITYALDEPRAGMGAFPQYHVSKLVKRHVTVVLTGHGGDELFAGYPLFKARIARSVLRNPLAALRALVTTKPTELPHLLYYLFYPLVQREVGYGTFILFSRSQQRSLFTPAFADATKGHDAYTYVRELAANSALSPEARVQEIYLRTYLPSLFIVEDKVGMAHSIEARTPLCDNEMLAFSQTISLQDKLHKGHLKSIPRDALRDRLPSMLYSQPKKGFPTPLSVWLRGPLRAYMDSVLLDGRLAARDIVSRRAVEHLVRRHCKRKTDGLHDYVEAARLWSLMQVELWFRIFIDGAEDIRTRSRL